jgi:hypothetical protein
MRGAKTSTSAQPLMLADDAILYADLPSTAATEADRAAANRLMLQQFFDDIESSERVGMIPPGHYPIDAALNLPLHGRVLGCGEWNTVIQVTVAEPFQGTLLNVLPGSKFLEVAHLALEGPTSPASTSIGIAISHTSAGVIELNFHDLRINNVYGGVFCDGNMSLAAGHFFRILFGTAGYSMILRGTVGCRLLYLTSDHVQHPQNTSELADFIIEGISGAGGGVWMEYVVSQYPYQNGILVRYFSAVWGRHLSGDTAFGRGIWFFDCDWIYLQHCQGPHAGRLGDQHGSNSWGYGIVIENQTLPGGGPYNGTQVTLADCEAGPSITDGLLLKRVRNVTVTGGVYVGSLGDGIKIDGCEQVSINGALVTGADGSRAGIEIVNSTLCAISGCELVAQQSAILGYNSQEVAISGNVIRGSQTIPPSPNTRWWMINVYGYSWTVVGNTISRAAYGIYFNTTALNVISNNCIIGMNASSSSAPWAMGIMLEGANDNVVSGNNITGFQRGFTEWAGTNRTAFTGNVTRGNALGNFFTGAQTLNVNNII